MTSPDVGALLAADRAHVWHPYATMPGDSVRYVVDAAAGVRLRLVDAHGARHEVVDGMSSWWAAVHGYRVPELDAALHRQTGQMAHVMFGGLTHRPAVELTERLVSHTPDPLQHVFLCDSGSVAVEVAMKMALQAAVASGRRARRFFTVRGGYHGDTFSPMSVTDPVGGMHALFTGVLPEHVFAPRPPSVTDHQQALDEWETATRDLYAAHADEIAGVIVEPMLQGAGGMHAYPARCIQVLAELARAHGAVVIHDEIATGWWRTGPRWASEESGVTPDVLCTGKALTGGYLTMGAVLCTGEVARAVSAQPAGALMHGPTFMGNPLAASVACASIDLLDECDAGAQVARINQALESGLAPLRDLPGVRDVRTLGAVGVVQLDGPVAVEPVTQAAVAHGVWVRPFRDLVYTMPPYACTDTDLQQLTTGLSAGVRAGVEHLG